MDSVFLESLIWNLNMCGAQMVVAALSKLWIDLHGKDCCFHVLFVFIRRICDVQEFQYGLQLGVSSSIKF